MWQFAKHYTTIMSNNVCNQLVINSWLAGFLITCPLGLQLGFCDLSIIDHFTCDSSPLRLMVHEAPPPDHLPTSGHHMAVPPDQVPTSGQSRAPPPDQVVTSGHQEAPP
ncbi:LOW QUALITY PROTEIN: hypothetical protein QTO34_017471 [Cnephaeus nilssonii]|uniref:Uncharacterized protein n=1 Tax=Cnephaeus nilssonii TaxID=3371016 RepID=A0AA40LPW6_CNENI|nr:LOW QUALITY PROTEIN: hypothetical protein QTO34_017471 [Eptesicus nilssonii]